MTSLQSDLLLASFNAQPNWESTLKLLAIWIGPPLIAAVIVTWATGRSKRVAARATVLGAGVTLVTGCLGCMVHPLLYTAPLIGVGVAVYSVLRSGYPGCGRRVDPPRLLRQNQWRRDPACSTYAYPVHPSPT